METPTTPLTTVAAAVIRDSRGRVLLTTRPAGRHMEGLWEFPGGKVKPDENPAQALARELREELGVEAEIGQPLTFAVHEEQTLRIALLFFEARIVSGSPKPLDGQEIRWVEAHELPDYPTPPADRAIIRQLAAGNQQPAVNEERVYDRISDAVGWTPLVRLNRVVEGSGSEVFAKIEFMNPMGSVKDRIARFMVEKAVSEGRLQAGDMVVENSSGNTALGLAMMCILEELRCTMVIREQTSQEKLACLNALGINLVLVDGDLPPQDPESYNRKAKRIVADCPGAYFPDQHNNRDNSEAHYHTTGPEIWRQMHGQIDYLVAGIGTGGTICGVSRYLKEQDPTITTIAVDPEGSVFFDHFHSGRLPEPGRYLIEGLGDEEIIGCPDFGLIDDMYRVTDHQAFLATRELARSEAILAGGSSGAALWAVRQLLATLDRPARIVTLFPDSGARYMSTIYNDEWMRARGFL